MKELSVFIDESGDFDLKSAHSPFYIFTLVFHDQSIDINHDIKQLDQHLDEKKFKYHAIHTAPLIRKEPPYQNYSIEDRKVLFNQMYHFTRQTNIQYKSFCYVKKNYEHKDKLISTMARDLSSFLRENLPYYYSFDKIKIYYDNGQNEISNILNISFNTLFSDVEIKRVNPIDYKLFQVADFICTVELLSKKYDENILSNSEKHFFKNLKEIKTIIKTIRKKTY